MKNLFALFFFLLLTAVSFSQVAPQPDGSDIQDIIENNAQITETESFDYDAGIDELENFKDRPINLNRATAEDLNDFPLLNAQQISALLDHIERFGKLLSVYELQGIPGFDILLINRMLPYIKVDNDVKDVVVPIKKLLSKGSFVWVTRYRQTIEKAEGYKRTDGSGYLGHPFNLFTRFRYTYGTKLSYGFTAEKDAGEEFFKGTNKQGFDFYSGHLFLRNFKALKALALGDFEVRLGQGLIIWSGFGIRKSPAVMNVKREGMKLRPYTSVNESNFMRGAGFTVGGKGFEFTAFGSYKQVDANIVTVVDSSIVIEEAFTAFNESGFHRTAAENLDRNSVGKLVTGGNFSYNKRKWHIGANALYTKIFQDFKPVFQPYNQFNLSTNSLVNASIDYHVLVKNFQFFGEEAVSNNGGFALLNGVLASIDPKVDISVVHRYYARNYQQQFAAGFGEASNTQNENGLYLGLSVKPISMLRLEGYFDLYMSKWLKYLTDAPSFGSDNYLQATFTPNKKFEMYLRYRYELKKKNESDNETPFDYLVNEKRQSLRYNIKFKVSDAISLANRIEWSFYRIGSNKPENGFLIYQDVNFKWMKSPVSFNARLAIFKTSSYNTRMYAYENDVLYSFSIPAYYGNGMRYYLTARYSITRNIDLWARFSQTYQFDTKTMGSGLDEIDKQHKNEVKVQLRLKF